MNIADTLDEYATENDTTVEQLTDLQVYRAMNNKPKSNRKGGVLDNCYTPPHAILPLIDHLQFTDIIWESAPGDLFMVNALRAHIPTIVHGNKDFFEWQPGEWDIQITNPPYSAKYPWLQRSYELGKPFALLLPVESIGAKSGNTLIAQYGAQFILLTKRINFHMPFKGYEGNGAQFPVLWWTYGLNLPKDIMVWDVDKEEYI